MRTRIVMIVLLALAGCAQNTETPVAQPIGQQNVTPTSTDQMAATEGTRITYNFFFGTTPSGHVLSGDVDDPGDLDDPQTLPYKLTMVDAGGTKLDANVGWSFQGNQFTFSNTTGGTTPSLAGTTTGTGTATAAPVAYPTVTPTQDVRPEASVAVPVGVALPGGIASPQGSATGRGTSETTQANQQEAWAMITKMSGEIGELRKAFEALLSRISQTPASQPANYGVDN